MPIYEYFCPTCGRKIERIQASAELAPVCCDVRMERVHSVPARAQFKGSGFYETDYRKKKGQVHVVKGGS